MNKKSGLFPDEETARAEAQGSRASHVLGNPCSVTEANFLLTGGAGTQGEKRKWRTGGRGRSQRVLWLCKARGSVQLLMGSP